MSMKNSNDTIGNRTRDLPACSAVSQPTATPRDGPKEVLSFQHLTIRVVAIWIMMSSRLESWCHHFEGMFYRHLQG